MRSQVRGAIDAAIERGVPAYNEGNASKCFEIYRDVATKLASSGDIDEATAELLKAGLQRAEQCRSTDSKAWAMREVLDRCSVCVAIRDAITKGAPLFNDGRPRQCFELYAAVAMDCLGIGSVAPPGLEAALMQAQGCKDDSAAAWAIRDAFDAILAQWMPRANDAGRGSGGRGSGGSISNGSRSNGSRSNGGGGNGGGKVLLSRGERVALLSGDGSTWVPIADALLDTGNEARTLIAPRVARMLGLVADESAPPLAGACMQSPIDLPSRACIQSPRYLPFQSHCFYPLASDLYLPFARGAQCEASTA